MNQNQKRSMMWVAFGLLVLFIITAVQYHAASRQRKRSEARQKAPQKNIYLITASGLRPDHLSSYLYQHIQTPAIDFLAGDGVRFTHAYTTSPESLAAHLSLLTGLYPFQKPLEQTVDSLYELGPLAPPDQIGSLPEIFRKQGYRTVAFLSDPELRFPVFFGKLFEQIYTGDRPSPFWQDGYKPAEVCKLARDWVVEHQSEPQLMMLNFGDPARPFNPPPPYNKHYENHPYDGEIAALDEQVGLFINLLKTNGLFEKSIVVLTSPYGENVDGNTHNGSIEDQILNVPLLIAAPGLLPNHQVYDSQASIVDVFPTIFRLIEKEPAPHSDGLPLFEKGSTEQKGHEIIMGESTFPHLFHFPELFFVRSAKWKLVQGSRDQMYNNYPPDTESDSLEATQTKAEFKKLLQHEAIAAASSRLPDIDFDPSSLVAETIELLRNNTPEFALDIVQSFESQMPSTAFVLHLIAQLEAQSGDPEKASTIYNKSFSGSGNPVILADSARTQMKALQYADAVKTIRNIRNLSYYEYSLLGIAQFYAGAVKDAFLSFDRAILLNPRYSEAYLYRGTAYSSTHDVQRAGSDFRQAIQLDPDDPAPYREIAELFKGKEDSIPYLRKLLEMNPQDYATMLELANVEAKTGNQTEAKSLSEQILLYSKQDDLKARAKEIIAQ